MAVTAVCINIFLSGGQIIFHRTKSSSRNQWRQVYIAEKLSFVTHFHSNANFTLNVFDSTSVIVK